MPSVEIDSSICTPGQRTFAASQAREVLLSGGYGAGKTLGLVIKVLLLSMHNPGVPGLIVAPTWRTMWGVTYRRLREVLAHVLKPDEMPKLCDRQGECYIHMGDGVPIFLRSARNHDGFDGLDVGYAVGDEARYWSRDSYHVVQGRIRVKCPVPQLALASTPEMGWLSDEFNTGKKGRQLVVAPTRENMHNLAPGFIENLKRSYSARMWRALIDGLFTVLEGAVFEAFDPMPQSPWFVDFDRSLLRSCPVYLAVDPGYRRSSWLFICEVGKCQWVVFDQLIMDNASDAACVREVNGKGYPVDEIWFDPAASNVQSFEGASTATMLRTIKARKPRPLRTITSANRSIAYGVDKLRVLLGGDDNGMNNPRRILFDRGLLDIERHRERGIVKDIASLRYPETKDRKPISDIPLKDGIHDHGVDSIRYWAVGRWLCDRNMRRLDPLLAQSTNPGWRSV